MNLSALRRKADRLRLIFFTSAFLGVGWSIHHLLLFIHDFSDYYNNIDIKYSFALLIFFIHMYFKSILLTSPWLALLAVYFFSWHATLRLPLHPFPTFSFQLLASVPGSHQRVIFCSTCCGWAGFRPVDQTEYFPSSGCRFWGSPAYSRTTEAPARYSHTL